MKKWILAKNEALKNNNPNIDNGGRGGSSRRLVVTTHFIFENTGTLLVVTHHAEDAVSAFAFARKRSYDHSRARIRSRKSSRACGRSQLQHTYTFLSQHMLRMIMALLFAPRGLTRFARASLHNLSPPRYVAPCAILETRFPVAAVPSFHALQLGHEKMKCIRVCVCACGNTNPYGKLPRTFVRVCARARSMRCPVVWRDRRAVPE